MSSTPPVSPNVDLPNEVSGSLKLQSQRKAGVYGVYWNGTLTLEGGTTIPATVSEKVWLRAGLAEPASGTEVSATAKRNANGRWNVVDVNPGIRELKAATALFIGLLEEADVTEPVDRHDMLLRFRLQLEATAVRELVVQSRVLEKLGIYSLPKGFALISDWKRQASGWQLERVCDECLQGFFQNVENEMATAAGYSLKAWKFDEKTKHLSVALNTDISGLVVTCTLKTELLRNFGVRSVGEGEAVKAHVILRDGSWRLADLIEPRPDRFGRTGDIIYAVHMRFAYQEENHFGEVEDWLEIEDERVSIGITTLAHTRLMDINEDGLAPGATIVCDLKRGKNRWYASRVHRVAD